MVKHIDIKTCRQTEYLSRSRSARFYAKILMPITAVAFSLALWSDEEIKPQLIAQVEEIKPVVAEYLADTPLQDMLGFGGEFASSGTSGTGFEEEALVTPSTLMASARPVVRPGAE